MARATDELVQLLAPIVELGAETAQPIRTETIILRDRKDKKQIDYPDTAETETMRDQVQFINEHLKRLHLIHEGKRFDIPVGRRVFNGYPRRLRGAGLDGPAAFFALAAFGAAARTDFFRLPYFAM